MKHKLYTDGGSRGNPGPGGIGCVILDQNDKLVDFDAKYAGKMTNNQAEYHALILGIQLVIDHNINDCEVYMDSELIVRQLNGVYKVKDVKMKVLYEEVVDLLKQIDKNKVMHVKRENNKFADKLVNIALDIRKK